MLTRPGSEPGSEWMLRAFVFVGVIQVTAIVAGDIAVYRAHGRHIRSYSSPIQIAGMPLLSMGGKAHGVLPTAD